MNDNNATLLNRIMYYVVCPLIVLEFILLDLGYLPFGAVILIATFVVFIGLIVITCMYAKNHPKYEYKVNDIYTKVMFVVIMIEFLFVNGFSFTN